MTDTGKDSDNPPISDDDRWKRAWGNLFGMNPVQVFFPDQELKARVYTLDEDSGYNIVEKTVFGNNQRASHLDHTVNLNYPKKARQGEKHGMSRLKVTDVLAVREWADGYLSKKEVPPYTQKATEMNVSEGALRDIVHRRTWAHV